MVKSEPDAETAPLPPRQRKWHPRVFTGCVNCRRRHVKCDERTPSCTNCTRLSLSCNFDRRFVFKAVRPSSRPAAARRRKTASTSSNNEDEDDEDEADDDEHAVQLISSTSAAPAPSAAFVASPLALPTSTTADCRDALYYHHFLHTVSSYLIIYDTPANANPYRRLLPQLVGGGAGLLRDAMRALGAMHLSGLPGVPDRRVHRSTAVRTYASVVSRLRDAVSPPQGQADLEMLATSLLLCMLEQMSSADASWKIHLVGAGQIFHSLYSPRTGPSAAAAAGAGAGSSTPLLLPLRRFLVSTMSYLDVAAACATGGGPLIAGDYWETLGGGWEYNLGAPSLVRARSSASHRTMAQLRSSWSRVMSIQTDISRFAKLLRSGLDGRQSDMFRSDIAHRIRNWHDSVPDVFLRLDDEPVTMTTRRRDEDDEDVDALTAAACILSYALACTIYLERVSSRRVGSAVFDPTVKHAVDRILRLVGGFSSGVHRLAMLWALLTGGIATADAAQQSLLRQWLTEMKSFGFKHVSRVLDTLECAWQHGDYDELELTLSSNLVP
ncbi:hypothetical protein L249_0067 [Ophiocordyceps polyrhachis-furcata BCC 54312]|uniref:Zn(2)-C6 fungal-type domain-containing protein n=1 Tax=Ophiocordyceps polyrhachis-furcata BCC 54312 TaxID=1330021 RepID=A0A367LD15_9HYPO|nr:hypothetical protein L249_0067 [Ophiocordyceps polyrhachis-furcata BCC 54312]